VLRGQCMRNRIFLDKFIGSAIIALGSLVFTWFKLVSGTPGIYYLTGLLGGLLAGFISACLLRVSSVVSPRSKALRRINIFLILVLTFLFAIISPSLAGGYFSGVGITLCFGYSIGVLTDYYSKKERGA